MNLLEIFAQVGEGMGDSILIFVLTLYFRCRWAVW